MPKSAGGRSRLRLVSCQATVKKRPPITLYIQWAACIGLSLASLGALGVALLYGRTGAATDNARFDRAALSATAADDNSVAISAMRQSIGAIGAVAVERERVFDDFMASRDRQMDELERSIQVLGSALVGWDAGAREPSDASR